jgi:restriction system protein
MSNNGEPINSRTLTPTELAWAVIESLRESGAASVAELDERVAERLKFGDESALFTRPGESTPWLRQKLGSVRTHLRASGYIVQVRRAVWALTQKGENCSAAEELAGFTGPYQQELRNRKESQQPLDSSPVIPFCTTTGDLNEELPDVSDSSWREDLLRSLRELSPRQFEEFIRDLLEAMGMTDVVVTGRSGDGGVDLRAKHAIGPGVNVRVLVQCKRYGPETTVGPEKVRELAGTMHAEHSILITTGFFTSGARKTSEEVIRRVDLWDGMELCDVIAEFGVGVIEEIAYRPDPQYLRNLQEKFG